MWYLRKFPTIVDYETYKNNPDEFLVPNVSYVGEVTSHIFANLLFYFNYTIISHKMQKPVGNSTLPTGFSIS